MLSIVGRNVNEVYIDALWKMKIMGVPVETRNGPAKRIYGPVATTYMKPTERMLINKRRDANPFFHLFEGVWMLAGRKDVAWLKQFNSTIDQFSDDGVSLNGAYGHRWREHFDIDQLLWVIGLLQVDQNTRRAVVQMFDPIFDTEGGKDIPCNTAIYFEVFAGYLNMTVTNRSNDMIWGAYGANAVHMSMLQEFVAGALGFPCGQYVQFSNNFHIYERHFPLLETADEPYIFSAGEVASHIPLTEPGRWQADLEEMEYWLDNPGETYASPYINNVLTPMLAAWHHYKANQRAQAEAALDDIHDLEVRQACREWFKGRTWRRSL